MNLLCMDTSSLACTAGVLRDGTQFVRYEERAREHTQLLLPMIRSALAEARLTTADLDAVVLGNGPGSFVGLRIAAAVAQGLAYGAGLEVAPVSSLAAIAFAAGSDGDTVAVTGDAHMQQVYLGLYRRGGPDLVSELEPERLHGQQRIDALAGHEHVVAAGAGWHRYPALLEANRALIASVSDVRYPHAAALLTLGERAVERGLTMPPGQVDPVYLREQVAVTPAAGAS